MIRRDRHVAFVLGGMLFLNILTALGFCFCLLCLSAAFSMPSLKTLLRLVGHLKKQV